MRSYYCNICQKTVTFETKELIKKCSCSKVFEAGDVKTHSINMNNHWSTQTKVEFSQTTLEKDIKSRGGNF